MFITISNRVRILKHALMLIWLPLFMKRKEKKQYQKKIFLLGYNSKTKISYYIFKQDNNINFEKKTKRKMGGGHIIDPVEI